MMGYTESLKVGPSVFGFHPSADTTCSANDSSTCSSHSGPSLRREVRERPLDAAIPLEY